jgi:hypothetical protein
MNIRLKILKVIAFEMAFYCMKFILSDTVTLRHTYLYTHTHCESVIMCSLGPETIFGEEQYGIAFTALQTSGLLIRDQNNT